MAEQGGSLVGRAAELTTLSTLLDDAQTGRGRSVVILGEPGIGKTALVESFSTAAEERGVTTVWGRCTEVDAPAFWPWRQALGALGVGTLESQSTPGPRAELFARVLDDLSGSLDDTPTLLSLEDIHWADAASLELLRFLVDTLPGLPLFLMATVREGALEQSPEAAELLRSLPAGVERLPLTGLEQEEIGRVIAGVLGYQPTPDVVERIADRSGGNPFFAREVARLHASHGPNAELIIPPGVRQVLERRMTRLSRACYETLAVAAVIGETEPGLISETLEEPEPEILGHLGEGVEAGLLISDGTDSSFAHALVREMLYDRQPAAWRSSVHRRVAEALDRRTGSGRLAEEALQARLAVHWRRSSGPDARRLAAEHAVAAARDARDRMGYEQAVRYYQWALEEPAEDELDLRIELGETQIRAGQLTLGRDTLRTVAETALDKGHPSQLGRAVLALGGGIGGFEVDLTDQRQIGLLEEALARSDDLVEPLDPALRAAMMARLSLVTAGLRSEDDRTALAEEAIQLARGADDPRTEVAALGAWCDARAGPDYTEQRLDRSTEMEEAAERSGDPTSQLLALRFRAAALAERGDFAAFDEVVAAYARISDRLTLPLYGWLVPIWHGMRALMAGDLAATRRHAAEADHLGSRADSLNAVFLVMSLRMWLCHNTEDFAELKGIAHTLLGLVPDHPTADAVAAGWLAMTDETDEARRRLRRALGNGVTIPRDSEYLGGLWFLAEAVITLDEPDSAQVVYDVLEPYASCWVIDGIGAATLGLGAHQLGRLAGYQGRHDEAEGWLDQALEAHRTAKAPILAARTEAAIAEFAAARSSSPQTAPSALDAPERGELERSGKVWLLTWRGEEATVPDSKGIRDLAVLLSSPNREVHTLDLVEAAGGPPAKAAGSHAGEILDSTARTAYRQRLADLEDELTEAETHGDVGRTEALKEEQQFLAAELAGALGLGGRARTAGDPVERARTAVTNRIRTALKAIDEVHPELARHLDRSISTGRFCAYRPERPVRWKVT